MQRCNHNTAFAIAKLIAIVLTHATPKHQKGKPFGFVRTRLFEGTENTIQKEPKVVVVVVHVLGVGWEYHPGMCDPDLRSVPILGREELEDVAVDPVRRSQPHLHRATSKSIQP